MSKRIAYKPKLDSLRAIAALMVLFSHYFVETGGPDFKYGGNGVQIFFVISGYLITGILLAQKEITDISTGKIYGNFIIKRALRLFPVYYLFLGVITLLSKMTGLWLAEPGQLWHYFTYTQNYLFFKEGFKSTMLNHTWSLAVEEQFYLFWPLVILFIPRRSELVVLCGLILTGIISKIYFLDYYSTPGTVKGVTLIHFDTLGAGALLAWIIHNNKTKITGFLIRTADLGFAIAFLASAVLTYIGINDSVFMPLSLTVMSLYLVVSCTIAEKSMLDGLLNLRFLSGLGKMSYGLYLFHKPVPFAVNYIFKAAGWPVEQWPVLMFLIYFMIAIMITLLSWRLFEQPILRLKERFDL